MIDKYKEINIELGKSHKVNDDLSKHIDTLLAYGPYDFGIVNIGKENSAEKRIREDLNK